MEKSEPSYGAMWTFKLVAPYVIVGYLCGLAVTLAWNWWQLGYLVLSLNLTYAFPVAIVLALLYSRPVRCILTLAVPSLCSSRGRAFLISLAFVVAAVGPTANIVSNLKVMLRSLACGQELLRQALGQMLDVILEPVNAIQLAVDLLLQEVRRVLKLAMLVLLRIQDHLVAIIETLKNCAAWLKSIVDMCNTEMGTPWARCKKTAHQAMIRCQSKLGVFKALCHATKLFLALCYPAKIIDVFCSGYWDFSWGLLDKIFERYREFVRHIEEMFDANITFEHEFFFDTNSSKSLVDVGEEIIQDINKRLPSFIFLSSFVDILCWVMVVTVFLKATIFYLRYMHSRQFQNVFMTKILSDIDRRYEKHGYDPLLPLQRLERSKYMKLTSLRLTLFEFVSIVENACFMATTCLQLFAICFLDYGLFWLLTTMSFHGHQESGLEVPAYVDLEIKERAKERGSFLYNMISEDRSKEEHNFFEVVLNVFFLVSIFKFVRRRKRNKFNHTPNVKKTRNFTWLYSGFSCLICLCSCCPFCQSTERCTICGRALTPSNRNPCDTPGCKGVYCSKCFEKSHNKCCLCNRPVDYGDFSDVTEVDDSSDYSEKESFSEKQFRKTCGAQR
ncbi:DC-STAMP domain-containing protein 2 isoform X3 [Drosophila yakuba]|uniref:DC-STAMP domain-containing protein 2 isoform X3 n=1 Tax=Drosophila yakuba TaxID=7245 RepID=UPI00193085D6|nr:DC-STAMP domain-containing protein 2 isoform X3 [Drosophila yakuba]